jgi:hypothetical protein
MDSPSDEAANEWGDFLDVFYGDDGVGDDDDDDDDDDTSLNPNGRSRSHGGTIDEPVTSGSDGVIVDPKNKPKQ